jgi:hypothetical protein
VTSLSGRIADRAICPAIHVTLHGHGSILLFLTGEQD